MSFESPSYQPVQITHAPKTGQMQQEYSDGERSIETDESVRTQKLFAEAFMFINKSRLLGSDPNVNGVIRTELQRAKDTNNTGLLERIITTLKEEKRFILDYARQFANRNMKDVSIYQLQAGMRQAYLEKMVYAPERQENNNSETMLKQLYRDYQLT